MNPTKEQIQGLWEQCVSGNILRDLLIDGTNSISLNNLFKYAVPKVKFLRIEKQHYPLSGDWLVTIQMYKYEIEIDDNDLALALFWAIYKALGGKE